MRDIEHQTQCACVRFFRYAYPKFARLLFAVPNGGQRSISQASKLKAEGVVSGVSDLILLVPSNGYHALCIEMKTDKGKQSEHQKEFEKDVVDIGYKYVICRSVDDFINEVKEYLNA